MNIQSLMSPSMAALETAVATAQTNRDEAVASGSVVEVRIATQGLELAQDLLKHAVRAVANATRTAG